MFQAELVLEIDKMCPENGVRLRKALLFSEGAC
jgi:hypothetical protein